jgi:drug/metabolite transporter (DMT)-like permease
MTNHILSVIVAFVAYSMLDLSKAVQKIAFERRERAALATLIWIGATASTTVSSFLLLWAVSLGSVLVVGAMAGTGLASLTVFAALVMKERVTRRDVAGVIAILLGPVALGGFSGSHSPNPRLAWLYVFFAAVVFIYLVFMLVGRVRGRRVGIFTGGFAGALGGFVLLFQKVSTTVHGRSLAWISALEASVSSPWLGRALETLVNPYAVAWIVISIVSTIVLQFAYRSETAMRIVPMFAANTIVVPVIGGLLCFQDRLHPVQWFGLALVLVGVSLVTIKPERTDH